MNKYDVSLDEILKWIVCIGCEYCGNASTECIQGGCTGALELLIHTCKLYYRVWWLWRMWWLWRLWWVWLICWITEGNTHKDQVKLYNMYKGQTRVTVY